MNRVVITGMGIVTSNAVGKNEFQRACTEGISGIKKCMAFPTNGLLTDKFGQADLSAENRLYGLIEPAVHEMLDDAGITAENISEMGLKCRMFFGTLLATAETGYRNSLYKMHNIPDNGKSAAVNDYVSYLKKVTGLKGAVSICSAACASGTTAAGMAFDYIRNGICDTAILGGADPLTIISAYGFHCLKSLSRDVCNPFDIERDGINIGECSAFFFAETLERAKERHAKIYCELAGYGLGNDAYHATSPDPQGDGAYHTMLAALKDGNIEAEQIDYINAHGTGTVINDSMETKAIERLFEGTSKKPAVSSTKALIGHCMGASGAVELASVILSMQSEKYIPMPNLKNPVSNKFVISQHTMDMDIRYALSNSFAFAGSSACLLIKKYDGGESV